jgi:predicted exporter
MGKQYFDMLYAWIGGRRWFALAVMLCLTAAALTSLRFIHLSSNIESMLPEDAEIIRSMDFLKHSAATNKVIISLSLNSTDKGKGDLFAAADMLKDSLRPPFFTKVTVGLSGLDMAESMKYFSDRAPYLLSEKDMQSIESMITRKGVAERMQRDYLMLLKPEGIFMGAMLRSDPLGINALVMNKVKALAASLGYSINIENGHFISRDGRHALVIAQTPVSAIDTLGSKRLLYYLGEKIKGLPPGVSADIISGHTHSLSNERVLKRDVGLTSIVASIAFILLFLFVFADLSAVLIFLIPLFAIFQSIYLCYFFLGGLSYSVVGLSTVLAGISVDYGIFVYMTARNADNPADDVRRIAGPVSAGALTTLAVFFSFLFSSMGGYRQLGYLIIVGLVLSMIYSFLILPHFFSKKKVRLFDTNMMELMSIKGVYVIAFWAIPTVFLLFFAFTVRFNSNIYKIDGTEPAILRTEERFHKIWGQDRPAILVATGENLEKALEKNDAIYKDVAGIAGGRFTSLTTLLPSEKTQRENFERWKRFWSQERIEKLRRLITETGAAYGFSGRAFLPFFKDINSATYKKDDGEGNDFIVSLKDRFVQKDTLNGGNGYQILSFFSDDAYFADSITQLIKRYPGAFIVSPRAFSSRIAKAVYSDIILMTVITASLVILFTYFYFRNLKELLLALVPVATSIIWVFGLMAIFGILFNLSTLITAIALMGICVDYGIFMVYRCRTKTNTGVVTGVSLAALTTVIGTGVLIFAKHPALFNVGVTMTIGITTGYLSSIFVVPYLYHLMFPSREKLW